MRKLLKTTAIGVLVLVAVFVSAAKSIADDGATSQDEETQRVDSVVKAIIAADNVGDHAAVVSLYADDAVLISPSGPNVEGIDAISDHYAALFAQSTLSINNTIDQTVVSGDWAMSRGTNRVVATQKVDGESAVINAKYVMTFRRDSERGWLIVHVIWSNQQDETNR